MRPDVGRSRVPARAEAEDSASLFGAAAEVFSAGQQMILDRVDLLQAEVTSDVRRLVTVAALFSGAFAIVLLGWAVWVAALTVMLDRWLPLDGALAVAGGLQVALGAGLGGLGYRRMSQPTPFDAPSPREDFHA